MRWTENAAWLSTTIDSETLTAASNSRPQWPSATATVIGDGASLPLGDHEVRIIHTPGHTDDSLCLHVGDALFTGDTLFVGKVGGTWSEEDSGKEYVSLHEKLMQLPKETRVFPGHDYGTAPESTIGEERAKNPFLLQPDLKSFKDLKANWGEYKKKHGIP